MYEDGVADAEVVRVFRPRTRIEEMEAFEKLIECVSALLDRWEGPRKNQLQTLWEYLRTYSGSADSEKFPSNRKLSQLLNIPRYAFPDLFSTLGRWTEECRAKFSGRSEHSESFSESRSA